MMAMLLACLTVTALVPSPAMAAEPAATLPPVGLACNGNAKTVMNVPMAQAPRRRRPEPV